MGVELHKDLLGSIGVDVERHAKMMGMGLDAYKSQFMSEIQAERIAEINALRAKKKPIVGTFCIFVPKEIVVGAGGVALSGFKVVQ